MSTYSAVVGALSSKPFSPSTGVVTDGRSNYYDTTNFVWRDFQSRAEALAFLDIPESRKGKAPIFINTGGTLTNGVWSGGTVAIWRFLHGITDNDLIPDLPDAVFSGEFYSGTHTPEANNPADTIGTTANPIVPKDGSITEAKLSSGVVEKLNNTGGAVTVDQIIIDNSTNPVSGNAVFDALATKSDILTASIAYTSSIPFNKMLTNIASHTMTGNITLSVNTTGAVDGYGSKLQIVADGTSTIDLSAFKRVNGSPIFINNSGVVNTFLFFKDGSRYMYSLVQDANDALTQLSTPSLSAVASSGTQINVTVGAVLHASSYILEYSLNSGSTWTQAATVAGLFQHTGLANSTTVQYRARAIGDGITYYNSANATASATTSAGALYATWSITGSDMEQYNTSKGMRKKASGTATWSAAGRSRAVETLSTGETVVVKVGSDPSLAAALILATSGSTPDEGGNTNIAYGIYSGSGLTDNAICQQNNTDVGFLFAISAGDLLRMTYGVSNMVIESSTDNGSTWTNRYTSSITPSGTYNIWLQSYSVLGGFDEIYKA